MEIMSIKEQHERKATLLSRIPNETEIIWWKSKAKYLFEKLDLLSRFVASQIARVSSIDNAGDCYFWRLSTFPENVLLSSLK